MLYWGLKLVFGLEEKYSLQVQFLQNNLLSWIDTIIHVVFLETNNVLNICFLFWWISFWWCFLYISSIPGHTCLSRSEVSLLAQIIISFWENWWGNDPIKDEPRFMFRSQHHQFSQKEIMICARRDRDKTPSKTNSSKEKIYIQNIICF